MSLRNLGVSAVLLAAIATVNLVHVASASARAPASVSLPESVNLFQAMDAGDVDVKLIVKDGQQARIVAKNNTKKPLRIQIPEAFAAVPVLAQNQGGGGGGGGGGGFFNVPPEKVAKRDVGFLCLEHGKPDPRSSMQYELKPIAAITSDQRVISVIKQFGAGNISHAAAQAASWHLANQMSWQQLAGKTRRRFGSSQPYFSPQNLRQAVSIVAHVTKQQQASGAPTGSLAQ